MLQERVQLPPSASETTATVSALLRLQLRSVRVILTSVIVGGTRVPHVAAGSVYGEVSMRWTNALVVLLFVLQQLQANAPVRRVANVANRAYRVAYRGIAGSNRESHRTLTHRESYARYSTLACVCSTESSAGAYVRIGSFALAAT